MNDTSMRGLEQEALDLLVDGELDAARRRALLERIDFEPEGWKRCAMAFLEAQALGSELRRIVPSISARSAVAGRQSPRRPWVAAARALCAAAAVLVAFLAGRIWPGAERSVPPHPESDLVADSSALPWGSVTFALSENGAQKAQEIRVPLLRVSPRDPAWAWIQQALMDDEWLSDLQRQGHTVLERRQFVPLELEDGRQAVLPVDDVEIYKPRPVVY